MEDTYYIGFSAFVQLAVGLCVGMLYIDAKMDQDSQFTKFQKDLFDGFKENSLCSYFIESSKKVTERITTDSKIFLKQWKALNITAEDILKAELSTEKTCLYLTITSFVSILFSISWLFIVPECIEKDSYLTFCCATTAASFISLIYSYLFKGMKRAKALIYSVLIMILCNGIAFLLLSSGIHITLPWNFDTIFLLSVWLSYAPFIYYTSHIVICIIYRSVILLFLATSTLLIKLILYCLKKVQ